MRLLWAAFGVAIVAGAARALPRLRRQTQQRHELGDYHHWLERANQLPAPPPNLRLVHTDDGPRVIPTRPRIDPDHPSMRHHRGQRR